MMNAQTRLIGAVCALLLIVSSLPISGSGERDLNATCFSLIAAIQIEGFNPETGKPDKIKGVFSVQCKVDYVPNGLSWDVDLELISPSNRKKPGGITDPITKKDWGHQEEVKLDYEDGYWKFTYKVKIVDTQDNENVKVELIDHYAELDINY